jgi:hypothetical protein
MSGSISDGARDITIRNSAFSGALTIIGVANSNILLDHNTHILCSGCAPARVHLAYNQQAHSGVTISNSLFADGDSDGIQTGVGVNIIHNEFRNILEDGPNHTDNIQLIDAPGAVVRGNWIHQTRSGSTQAITAFNGLDHGVIEDNVVDMSWSGSRPWGIELQQDNGSIVRHNTLVYSAGCAFNLPCGLIAIRAQSSGTTVVDNIATRVDVDSSTLAARHHNMLRQSAGSGDTTGTPAYSGGASPTTYDGFRLAAGSPGKNAASDGTDVGRR